jgi:hypothetical protein
LVVSTGKRELTRWNQVADDAGISNPYNIARKDDPTGPLSDALDKLLATPSRVYLSPSLSFHVPG